MKSLNPALHTFLWNWQVEFGTQKISDRWSFLCFNSLAGKRSYIVRSSLAQFLMMLQPFVVKSERRLNRGNLGTLSSDTPFPPTPTVVVEFAVFITIGLLFYQNATMEPCSYNTVYPWIHPCCFVKFLCLNIFCSLVLLLTVILPHPPRLAVLGWCHTWTRFPGQMTVLWLLKYEKLVCFEASALNWSSDCIGGTWV